MPYTYGFVQKRETEGRRDDRVLLMAINNADLLAPWLSIITRLNVPLLGIYSLPLLSQDLLKYFPKAPYTLVIAHTPPIRLNSPAGLRQSFFIDNKLQFSRLISLPKPENQDKDSADFVLKQITTIRNYLENARIFPETEPATQLSVVILSHGVLLDSLKDAIQEVSSSLGVKIYLLDKNYLAQRLKLKSESKSELLHFVALQFLHRQRNHYAPDTGSLFYHNLRIILYLSAALLLSAATVGSTMILNNALIQQEAGEKLANQTAQRLIAVEKLKRKIPDIDIELILAVVDVGSQLKVDSVSPRPVLEQLSRILNRHPYLFIESLEWGIGSSKKEVIKLYGKIQPFEGNYQKALVIFNKFINELRFHKKYEVNVVVSPYNSKQILTGKIGLDTEITNQKAQFVVDIKLNL
jgi:hypothetical protein